MQQVFNSALGVLGAVFLFGFAVFVHELGHFIAAKWSGVGVKKFAIGFGPKIWAFVHGGTEYSIRWFPLGGFVALKGMIEGLEDEEEAGEKASGEAQTDGVTAQDAPAPEAAQGPAPPEKQKGSLTEDLDALRNRPAPVRIAVFAAGVVMNFLSAILLTGVLLWYGVPRFEPMPNTLEEIPEDTRLYEMGWRSGDAIIGLKVEFGDASGEKTWGPLQTGEEVDMAVEYARRALLASAPRAQSGTETEKPATSATLQAQIHRGGDEIWLPLPLDLFSDPKELEAFQVPRPPYVAVAIPASPAHRARLVKADCAPDEKILPMPTWAEMRPCPLERDDEIIAIEEQPVETWRQMTTLIRNAEDPVLVFTIRRGPEKQMLRLITVLEWSERNAGQRQLGIWPGRPATGERDALPFFQAMWEAPGETLRRTQFLVGATTNLVVESFQRKTFTDLKRNLGGPAVIGILAYKTAQQGLAEYLNLFIAISIILAVMNLLPIPVLDGGFILITLIETLIRRPIPSKVLAPILTVFMLFFITLFGLLFYNDFMNWVFKN